MYNFVARELNRYASDPSTALGQEAVIASARRAVEAENIGQAYQILTKVPENQQTAINRSIRQIDSNLERTRKFVTTKSKSIAGKLGDYDTSLKVFKDTVDEAKANYADNPDQYALVESAFMDIVNRIKSKEKNVGEVFEEYPLLGGGEGRNPNLEGMALVMAGFISGNSKGELVYADQSIYMEADGTINDLNRPGYKTLGSSFVRNNKTKIDSNLKKLRYDDWIESPSKDVKQSHKAAAEIYLKILETYEGRTPVETIKDAPETGEGSVINDIISGNIPKNNETEQTMIAGWYRK